MGAVAANTSHWKFPMGAVGREHQRAVLSRKFPMGRGPAQACMVQHVGNFQWELPSSTTQRCKCVAISNGSCCRQSLHIANARQFPMGAAVVKDSTLQMRPQFAMGAVFPEYLMSQARWKLPMGAAVAKDATSQMRRQLPTEAAFAEAWLSQTSEANKHRCHSSRQECDVEASQTLVVIEMSCAHVSHVASVKSWQMLQASALTQSQCRRLQHVTASSSQRATRARKTLH